MKRDKPSGSPPTKRLELQRVTIKTLRARTSVRTGGFSIEPISGIPILTPISDVCGSFRTGGSTHQTTGDPYSIGMFSLSGQ